jgi:coenzyme PQQ synthesis protein D (PqqD)
VNVARFEWNPEVVCTELEEGAVLLNMETRLYYSLNPTGLELFRILARGADETELARGVESRFDVSGEQASAAASEFLARLAAEGLVTAGTAATGSGGLTSSESGPSSARRPFTPPELVRHDEPLHDVSTSPFDPQLPLAE